MAATAEQLNEIMIINQCAVQIAQAITNEGNATTPLIEVAALDNLNDVLILYTEYLESIIPVPVP